MKTQGMTEGLRLMILERWVPEGPQVRSQLAQAQEPRTEVQAMTVVDMAAVVAAQKAAVGVVQMVVAAV
jgi:FtsZ-interacting cell division protein ZipA